MKSLLYRLGSYSRVWKIDDNPDVIVIESGLCIDADGSPHAYHPPGAPGLDYLANAGHPGKWWGIATDNHGMPFIQCADNPAPGYYVSTTALEDPSKKDYDPHHYVNSEEIPFFVLPSRPNLGAKLGDVMMILNPANGMSSSAIYADIGPASQIGEGSIALAKNLGINPDAKTGGIAHGLVSILFLRSAIKWPSPVGNILLAAGDAFMHLGGFSEIKSLFPEIYWNKF